MLQDKPSQRQKVTILGSTGSIGCSTLDVIRHNADQYEVFGLVANSNYELMFKHIMEFHPQVVSMCDEQAANKLKEMIAYALSSEYDKAKMNLAQADALRNVKCLHGLNGALEIAGTREADLFVGAVVGAAGLPLLLESLKTGKTICLANKEALVMSGQLFFDEANRYHSTIIPVDSEHSAIFQCLPEELQRQMGACDLGKAGISKIILTGSGGPCRELPLENFAKVTPEFATNHPVWSMGPKISVDSATMMNKALEFIEARYLFHAQIDQVQVIIHPQSVIHSMVAYKDGAVLAQLGQPDMRTPIARALAFPNRIDANVAPLDFTKIGALTFKEPDKQRYPCLYLGIEASKLGQAATTALNAANEVAVASFLEKRIPFLGIPEVVEHVLSKVGSHQAYALSEIMHIDLSARKEAVAYIDSHY